MAHKQSLQRRVDCGVYRREQIGRQLVLPMKLTNLLSLAPLLMMASIASAQTQTLPCPKGAHMVVSPEPTPRWARISSNRPLCPEGFGTTSGLGDVLLSVPGVEEASSYCIGKTYDFDFLIGEQFDPEKVRREVVKAVQKWCAGRATVTAK